MSALNIENWKENAITAHSFSLFANCLLPFQFLFKYLVFLIHKIVEIKRKLIFSINFMSRICFVFQLNYNSLSLFQGLILCIGVLHGQVFSNPCPSETKINPMSISWHPYHHIIIDNMEMKDIHVRLCPYENCPWTSRSVENSKVHAIIIKIDKLHYPTTGIQKSEEVEEILATAWKNAQPPVFCCLM